MSVQHEQGTYGDYWRGAKDELIAAGVCKAETFPEVVKYNGGKKTKRRYKVDGLLFTLDQDGLWQVYKHDPSRLELAHPVCLEPATYAGMTFEIGDHAYLHFPGGEYHQKRVVILSGYGLQALNDGGVPRKAYGYMTKAEGDQERFTYAWQLRDRLDKPAHIKLVRLEEEQPEAAPKCAHCGK